MLNVKLDEIDGVALLEPNASLSEADFAAAAARIDPYIEKNGTLKGVIIHVKKFPGWDSMSGMVSHLKFVRNHHEKIARVALATDSPLGEIGERLASHFISAEVRHFEYDDLEDARSWVMGAE